MELKIEKTMKLPADAIWEVLGRDFAFIADWWTDEVAQSELKGELGLGAERVITLKSGGKLYEKLTKFEAQNKIIAYEVTSGLPPIVKTVSNTWNFKAIDPSKTQVLSHLIIEFSWWGRVLAPVVKAKLKKTAMSLMDSLEAETQRRLVV